MVNNSVKKKGGKNVLFLLIRNKETGQVFAALLDSFIIIPCCHGVRKEGGWEERGGNCATVFADSCEVNSSGFRGN